MGFLALGDVSVFALSVSNLGLHYTNTSYNTCYE